LVFLGLFCIVTPSLMDGEELTTIHKLWSQSTEKLQGSIKKVPSSLLFISEPEPSNFGNPPNTPNSYWSHTNWLQSRFHFSFAEYHNPKNQQFGVLRVLNDDLVQPDRGFGTHPHSDMEIITYVVRGQLTHKDSMGTSETLGRHSIQFMTAGTGIRHSEHNLQKTQDLRFIQIWIIPRTKSLKPNYGSLIGSEESIKNKLTHLLSDVSNPVNTQIKINQDVNFYVSLLDQEKTVEFMISENRQVYLLCIEGNISFMKGDRVHETLEELDAAEIKGPQYFRIRSLSPSHFLILEMHKSEHSRF